MLGQPVEVAVEDRILATSTKTLEIQKRGVKKYLPEVRREIEVRREMWMVEYVVQIFCAAPASLGCARPYRLE